MQTKSQFYLLILYTALNSSICISVHVGMLFEIDKLKFFLNLHNIKNLNLISSHFIGIQYTYIL